MERPDGPQRRHPLARPRLAQRRTSLGLKVDFDKYSGNQKFLGLKSLVLDNLTQDPSGIHETVSMRFYERLGIPTPRETHVRLYVRGEYIGVYALVESIDKDFLARIYGSIGDDTQNDGWLYEFVWQDDWRFTDFGTELAPRSSCASTRRLTSRSRMKTSTGRSRS